jgi:hypothetical protein
MNGIGVCIDYDGTFTTNPAVWTTIIELMRANGADVFCITMRFPNMPISGFPGVVHYAAGQPKQEFARERGLKVDIWVDDTPAGILPSAEMPDQFHMRKLLDKGLLKFA